MSELLPCPFCGDEPRHNNGGNSTYGRLWWAVWCERCDIQMHDREQWERMTHPSGRLVFPAKECFDRWNTRTALSGGKE